jgi:drug/metabolite transporter (DMT)-like permease
MNAEHPWRGYLFIAFATLCWGGAATFGKAVFNGSLLSGPAKISPLVITQVRTTVAVLLLSLIQLARGGKAAFKISSRDLLLCFLIGTLGVAGSNFFYYFAIQKTTVAIAITVQYTAPVLVFLYMVLLGRERATARRTMAVLLALLGTALTIGLFQGAGKFSLWGIGSAVLAAFAYAFYNIGGKGLVTRNPPLTVMNYALLAAGLLWTVLDPPWRLASLHLNGTQWGILFLFACLSMLLPYIFYFNGLKFLDPTQAVIISCLEPVFAILFAWMFIHESIGGLQMVGVGAVLAATVLVESR